MMRDRPAPSRRPPVSVDVVLLTPYGGALAALLRREGRTRWAIPWATPAADETLDAAALRVARSVLRAAPAWLEQVGAFGDRRRHPGDAALSIAFVGLVPLGTPAPDGADAAWHPVAELPPLAPRQRAIASAATDAVRSRLDQAPVAFRLLPETFTLSELQQMYELMLGRPLHKASFRRALQAAWLVEPTDEWRSEGRGRPAQLYRYAPRKRRGLRRSVRFDLLGGEGAPRGAP